MFTALAGRTVYVQAVEGPELAEKAKAERTVTWVNRAPRGDITGRDGTVLASSAVSYDVGVNQSAIAQYERTEMRLNESTGANEKVVVDYGATAVAAQLAPILDVDPLELGAKLVGNRSYEVIAQEVSPDTWRKIKALDIPGVEPDQRTRRTYPAGTVAGNVLGFTHEGEHNRELIGAAGLELTQNKVLTGTDGKGSEEVGRSGVIIPTGEQEDEPARPGATVRTTLNPDLQSIAQETIDKTVAAQHADWGIVMAMEPATGKVVVLADSNSVDPSDPSATSEENRTARSVQAVFEPGSVGKVVTFATALEEGVIKPEDTWTIPYTWTSASGQTFKDSHEHETQTMTTAGVLAESSNVGTVQIGEKLADDVRYNYMKRFGWGQATGIEMPAESDGILYPPSSWDDRTRYTTMFGQGVAGTTLQSLQVLATVANKGEQMTPYLVSRILDPDLNEVSSTSTKVARTPIDSATASSLSSLMQTAVAEGTGTSAQVSGVQVAGKTGTAETGTDSGPTTWFVGFAGTDIDKPEIALAVVLDGNAETEDGATGGKIAGPVAAQVIDAAVNQ